MKSSITDYYSHGILEGMSQTKSSCEMIFIATCKATIKTLREMIPLSFHICFRILLSLLLLSLRQGLHVPWDTRCHRESLH